jgi:adenosylhomocysteine nucleosidase
VATGDREGLIDTPATIWRSPVALTRAVLNLMIAPGGSAAAVRSGRGYDYGATLAVRELAAEEMRNLVQVSDFDKYQGLIERRVIASILDFLDERGVDTAEYRTRAVPSMRIGSINNVGRGGFANFGSIGSNAVYQAPVTIGGPDPAPSSRAEVGVLTVLDQEIKAVVSVLRRMHDYRERRLRHGPLAYEAWLPDRWGRPARVAAVQTREPGNDQAVLAYRGLVEEFRPSVVLLVGIAGGVSPRVRIGDVVVADQVIAYDSRRETPQGPRRRGQAQSISAELGYRLNEFFAALPSPELRRATGSFGLHRGPIGAGNAVVTDANSEIRRWLADFHEKVLAVETESAGVARSFHETAARDNVRGWLAIRGISDTADASKGDAFHDVASAHAAEAMAMLLPYLP